jgi:hypothetical protein
MSRFASICLAVGVVIAVPAFALRSDGPTVEMSQDPAVAWREVKWPFLLDQWGTGRAFRCEAADCGVALTMYLRPKIGFCNCTSGVSDDPELDRVGDVGLIGVRFAPLEDGHPITVGWMNGRSRSYSVDGPAPRTVIALAFSDRCDVVVATIVADRGLPRSAERLAVAFLNGPAVLNWVEASLGPQQ